MTKLCPGGLKDKVAASGAVDTGSIPVRDATAVAGIDDRCRPFHTLRIGTVQLPGNLAVAPLAGTTDPPFRALCLARGAALVTTELVSVRGILHDSLWKRSWRHLAFDPKDGTTAIQLFGSDPEDFRAVVGRLLEHPLLARCAAIDINLGCPVAKVVKTGAGSALLRDPRRAAAVVRAAVSAAAPASIPVTAKIRSGWDAATINAPEVARRLEDAGIAAITVHARTRAQMYAGRADWQVIAAVRRAVTVPVWGNGDVRDADDVRRMIGDTGADGVQIGRAAIGDPWICGRLAAELTGTEWREPDAAERRDTFLTHLDGLSVLIGEDAAVREMRGQLTAWLRATPGAAKARARAFQVDSRTAAVALLDEWLGLRDGVGQGFEKPARAGK